MKLKIYYLILLCCLFAACSSQPNDVKYVKEMSLKNDIRIIIGTIMKVFRHSGVVEAGQFTMKDLDEERKAS